jgi:hypothetical protein
MGGLVSTAERWTSFSNIGGIVCVILGCVFLPLAFINRGFATLAAFSFVGMFIMMVIWVIAEGINIGVGSGVISWIKKQWNQMLGRDERGSYD